MGIMVGDTPLPVLCRRRILKLCRSISSISSEFMQETYTSVPAWLAFTPCGMSHAGRFVSGVIVAVCTMVTRFMRG